MTRWIEGFRLDPSHPAPTAADLEEILTLEVGVEPGEQLLDRYLTALSRLRFAGESDNRQLRPVLKRVAEQTAGGKFDSLSLEALNSLWLLEEPRAYFVGLVEEYERAPRLACFAMTILGRTADATFVARCKSIADAAEAKKLDSVPHLLAAYRAVEYKMRLADQIAAEPTIEGKVRILAGPAGFEYPENGSDCGPDMRCQPGVVWARAELTELSFSSPRGVALGLKGTSLHVPEPGQKISEMQRQSLERWDHDAKEWIVSWLSEGTRQEWSALQRAK